MRLKIANTILIFFGTVSALGLIAIIIWGLFDRPLATIGMIVFMSSIVAIFWALLVEAEEGEL